MIARAGNINAEGWSTLHKALRGSVDNSSVPLQGNYAAVSDIDTGMLDESCSEITVDNRAGHRLNKDPIMLVRVSLRTRP